MRRLFLFSITLLVFGCAPEQKKQESNKPVKPFIVTKPYFSPFNADSAYNFVEAQVAFGPRVPNTKPHQETAKYLEQTLKRLGANVFVQKAQVTAYNNEKLNIFNIIGRVFPEKENRVLLFAHWDSRHIADRDKNEENKDQPILGANDGASGVGVILEVIRALQADSTKPNIGVDVIFFDAEDYGQPNDVQMGQKADTWCLGSQYWANNPPIKNFKSKYGILLDMVGAADAVFPQEGVSLYYARGIVNKVWSIAARLGYMSYFSGQVNEGGITDDHVYVNRIAKIPSIDIIHYDVNTQDFGDFHHTQKDDMSIISKSTLKVVGEVVLATIHSEP